MLTKLKINEHKVRNQVWDRAWYSVRDQVWDQVKQDINNAY
jgi:hypothetical protein